jgi:stage IV sporulation protein FB
VIPLGRATAIAVTIGQGLAWIIGLLGLMGPNVMVILVAIFVYVGAAQEGQMMQIKVALTGLKVRQAYSRHAQPVHPEASLNQAVDLTLEGFQSDFPVCDGERLVGMLTRTDVLVGLKEYGPEVLIRRVMRREFPVARPDDDLFGIQRRMAEAGLDAIPVVDGPVFRGLLTSQDLEEVYRLVSVRPDLLSQGGWPRLDASGRSQPPSNDFNPAEGDVIAAVPPEQDSVGLQRREEEK